MNEYQLWTGFHTNLQEISKKKYTALITMVEPLLNHFCKPVPLNTKSILENRMRTGSQAKPLKELPGQLGVQF